jgi:hypothetical protein
MSVAPATGSFTRRRRLAGTLTAACVLGALWLPAGPATASGVPPARWSDPATWGGQLPGPSTVVTVDRPILVDVDASVAGVRITAAGSLIFDPAVSHRLRSTGNIINDGVIVMKPANATIVQMIQFVGVDESKFVGGTGDTPLASDVGLWTENGGRLDLEGTPKAAWTNATGAISKGADSVTVRDDTGWQVGDELAITPTAAPSPSASTAYDYAVVTALHGPTVTLSAATVHDHPAVTVAPGQVMTAEVLNLTRNVRLWGQPGHRAHVWVHSTVPTVHVVDYVDINFMGPRQTLSDGTTQGVTGRYGLHFHDSMGNTVGSSVTGTVVRNAGSHAFVPHMSDGITFSGDISHNTMDDAYWWDTPGTESALQDPTNHLTFEHDVASLVTSDPTYRGFRLAGFVLGRGVGNVAEGNVAVGIQGTEDASGFEWPELTAGSEGVWTFQDNVAHNNAQNGMFVWQNSAVLHVINRFTAYYNGTYGIRHGAYVNAFVYENSVLYGNSWAAIDLQAVSSTSGSAPQLTFTNMLLDGAGLSDYVIMTDRHNPASTAGRTMISGTTMRGYRKAGVALAYVAGEPTAPEEIDFVNDSWVGTEFLFNNGVMSGSLLRVQDPAHGSIAVTPGEVVKAARSGGKTSFRAAWNADVKAIPPFAAQLTAQVDSSRGATPSVMFCNIP